jgi:hypothetical protein
MALARYRTTLVGQNQPVPEKVFNPPSGGIHLNRLFAHQLQTCRQQSYFKVLGLISNFPGGKFFIPEPYNPCSETNDFNTIQQSGKYHKIHIINAVTYLA